VVLIAFDYLASCDQLLVLVVVAVMSALSVLAPLLMLLILPVALVLIQSVGCSAFANPGSARRWIATATSNPHQCTKSVLSNGRPSQSPSLLCSKKRRRRKSDDEDFDSPSAPSSWSDLPDFDVDDEQLEKRKTFVPSEPSDEITSAMMGSANRLVRSVDQLIADRSIEKKFQFDEEEVSSLPDLSVVAKQQTSELGKRSMRKKARVAAAMERKDEEEMFNPLAQAPFITDEKGEASAIKVSNFHLQLIFNYEAESLLPLIHATLCNVI